jgi:hypothetical protein
MGPGTAIEARELADVVDAGVGMGIEEGLFIRVAPPVGRENSNFRSFVRLTGSSKRPILKEVEAGIAKAGRRVADFCDFRRPVQYTG